MIITRVMKFLISLNGKKSRGLVFIICYKRSRLICKFYQCRGLKEMWKGEPLDFPPTMREKVKSMYRGSFGSGPREGLWDSKTV